MAIVDIDDSVRVKISPRKYILSNLFKSSATANFLNVISTTALVGNQSVPSWANEYSAIIGLPWLLEWYLIRNVPLDSKSPRWFTEAITL